MTVMRSACATTGRKRTRSMVRLRRAIIHYRYIPALLYPLFERHRRHVRETVVFTRLRRLVVRNGIYEEGILEKQVVRLARIFGSAECPLDSKKFRVGAAGLEPATLCLESRIQLSARSA
jgi:hypothetical protein